MSNEQVPAVIARAEAEKVVASREMLPIVPTSLEGCFRYAQLVINAGLAPQGFGNDPQKIAAAILKGMEVGLAPMVALGNIAVINGRPTIWGDGAVALVQSRGLITNMEVIETGEVPVDAASLKDVPDNVGVEVRITRKGQATPYIGKFTVGDAKRAKLWLKAGPWMTYPRRMLLNRARAFALRDGFADALAGLHIREEIEDLPMAPVKTDTAFLADVPLIEHAPAVAANTWHIGPDKDFDIEFARLLTVAKDPADIDALLAANDGFPTDEQRDAATGRRNELEKAAA